MRLTQDMLTKIIDGEDFIFLTNYNSTKSRQFESNNNIAALFFGIKLIYRLE